MHDVALLGFWMAVLGAGLGAAVVVHALGVPRTHVRDLVHVGVAVWILGWPAWRSPLLPTLLLAAVAIATALVPTLARRWRWAARLERSLSGADERWAGLTAYTVSYLLWTPVGLLGDPLPAAAGLLALSLGDGIGGAVGRRFGRHRFRIPGAKAKSLEGSLAVAVMSGAGALFAACWLGVAVGPATIAGAAVVAAIAEALAPRATDNLVVPAAVWLFLTAAG